MAGEVLAGSTAHGNIHADTLQDGARANGQGIACIQTVPKTCRIRTACAGRALHNRRHGASDSHSPRSRPIVRNLRGPLGVDVALVHPRKRQRDDGPRVVAVEITVCRPVVPEPQTKASKDTRLFRPLSQSVR